MEVRAAPEVKLLILSNVGMTEKVICGAHFSFVIIEWKKKITICRGKKEKFRAQTYRRLINYFAKEVV